MDDEPLKAPPGTQERRIQDLEEAMRHMQERLTNHENALAARGPWPEPPPPPPPPSGPGDDGPTVPSDG